MVRRFSKCEIDHDSSQSISLYPNSTLDLGSEDFAGFIEVYSGSECSDFRERAPTIGPNASPGLFTQIKAFWRNLFGHFNSLARPNAPLLEQRPRGYTVCIEKKSFFKNCMDKMTKRRNRCKRVNLFGPLEPLLEKIDDDAGCLASVERELLADKTREPTLPKFRLREASLTSNLNDLNLYGGRENVEELTDTLIDTPGNYVPFHPKFNPRVLERQQNSAFQ